MSVPADLLRAYDERFRSRFGVPAPIIGGKDAKIAKALLARYDIDELARWLDDFFATDDPFISASTYGLGVFQSVLGKLIAARSAPMAAQARRAVQAAADAEWLARRKQLEAEAMARGEV